MLCLVVELGAGQHFGVRRSSENSRAVAKGGPKLFSGLIPQTFRALDLFGRELHRET